MTLACSSGYDGAKRKSQGITDCQQKNSIAFRKTSERLERYGGMKKVEPETHLGQSGCTFTF